MNEIRAMYIQDEKEESRKEGRIEGKKEGKIEGKIEGRIQGKKEGKIEEKESVITNILKEINDVDYIHKITKYPRSLIIEIAEKSKI